MAARVLVVDDYSAHRVLLSTVVTRLGCRPVEAADGRTALSLAWEHEPALIILDLVLPDIDGLEVLRRLRADPRTTATPILIVTALEGEERIVEALEAGADDYITKPFEPAVLQARAKVLLRAARLQNELSRAADLAVTAAGIATAAASALHLEDLCVSLGDALRGERQDLPIAVYQVDGDTVVGPYGVGAEPTARRVLDLGRDASLARVLCGEVPWLRLRGPQLAALDLRGAGEAVGIPLRSADKPIGFVLLGPLSEPLREVEINRLVDRCGSVAAALTVVHERAARLASETRYRTLFEQAGDGVALLDPQTGVCREANHALAGWLSAVPKAFVGRPFEMLFDADCRAELRQGLEAAAQGRKVTIGELQLRGTNNVVVPVELSIRRISHGGEADMIVLLRDIRGREAIGRYAQVASDLGQLSKMVRALNHEINNPLTCIIGLTQLLQLRMRDLPEHVGQLDKILTSAEQITALTHQLREIAVMLGGEEPISDIDEILRQLAESAG